MDNNVKPNSMPRLVWLDSLRLVMAVIIVISHFEFLSNASYGSFYDTYIHNPTLALDYFFLLTGFGLFYSYGECVKNDKSYLSLKGMVKFGIQRIKKIYPLYIFSLVLALPCYICLFFQTSNTLNIVLLSSNFITDGLLLQSLFGMSIISHSINGVCWFLSCIFVCYIVSPLLLNLTGKVNRKRTTVVLIALTTIIIIGLSLAFKLIESKIEIRGEHYIDDLSYGSPYMRIFYVLEGMLIAKLFLLLKEKMTDKVMMFNILEVLISILCIVYFVFRNTLKASIANYYINHFCITGIDIALCSLLLFIFAFGGGFITKLLSTKWLVKASKFSSLIFLLHYPIRLTLETFYYSKGNLDPWNGFMGITVIVLGTVLLIAIYYCLSMLVKKIKLNKSTATAE